MKNFRDKVAAITGAGSGIGQALAYDLARRGAHLALSDIDGPRVEESAVEARRLAPGVKVTTRVVDVAKREAVEEWAASVKSDHGRCNLIINNAGVALGSTIEGASYDELHWIVGINMWGVVHGTKAFLPLLHESGEGHVVNVSSLFGLLSVAGQGAYNMTKFAVRGFTDALRQELEIQGAKVSATCVHPGGIRTSIARSARGNESTRTIGIDPESSRTDFEKVLTMPPSRAAAIILRAVEKNERRVLVGRDAHLGEAVQRLFPSGYQRLVMASMRRMGKR